MRRNGAFSVLLLALLSLTSGGPALAQCSGEGYDGFDFWLGDWVIEQKFRSADDAWIELPAETSVTKVLDGCALLERWRGEVQFPWRSMTSPRHLEGLSVRTFIPAEGVWRIQWMDSMNPLLADGHYGAIEDGRGEFMPRPKPDGGRWSKIVFDRKGPDRVHWHLDFTADDGKSFRTIWIMEMKRKPAGAEQKTSRPNPERSDASSP